MVSRDHSSALKGLLSEPALPKNSTSKWSPISGSTDYTHGWSGEQQTAPTAAPAKPQSFCTLSLLSLGFCMPSCLDTLHRHVCTTNPALKSLWFKILGKSNSETTTLKPGKRGKFCFIKNRGKGVKWDKKINFLVWLISCGGSFL